MRLSKSDTQTYVSAIERVEVVPLLLQVLCESTGLGLALVTHVTDASWTACAVCDQIEFGLSVGDQLDVGTTLCREVRASRAAIVIDHASADPRYFDHITPKIYGFESYISVPLIQANGEYFGNLCGLARRPLNLSYPGVASLCTSFARLIGSQLGTALQTHSTQGSYPLAGGKKPARKSLLVALSERLDASQAVQESSQPASLMLASSLNIGLQTADSIVNDVMACLRSRFDDAISLRFTDVVDIGEQFDEALRLTRLKYPDRAIIANVAAKVGLRCDPNRLRELALGLLSGGLMHGPGSRAVGFVVHVEDSNLVVEVWDCGNLIAPTAMEVLFVPILKNCDDDSCSCPGPNLYICSQIAAGHGGTLRVASSAHDGTHVVARIPLKRH